jgi:hypothetical protein
MGMRTLKNWHIWLMVLVASVALFTFGCVVYELLVLLKNVIIDLFNHIATGSVS